jgi:REP element-mobilizing transposase RayT
MIDHKVRQKRDNGARPYPEAIWLEPEDEQVIMQTLAGVVKEDNLHVLAANICGDHLHLLLVCEEEEVPKIVGKLKAVCAKEYNRWKGNTTAITTRGHVHLSEETYGTAEITRGHVPLSKETDETAEITRGHVPLSKETDETATTRGPVHLSKEKEKSIPLWTQKFGCKEIIDNEQLQNTIDYIDHNRAKHKLPPHPTTSNKGTCPLVETIATFTCDIEQAFATEYKGGFDVVIGNPPYVRQELITPFKPFFEKQYKTFAGTADLYTYFIEKGVDELIHDKGLYSIIVGNKWMRARFASKLRLWMKEKEIVEMIDFGDLPVFENVAAYPVIITLKKKTSNTTNLFYACEPKSLNFGDLNLLVRNSRFKVDVNELQEDGWSLANRDTSTLIAKLKEVGTPLSQFVSKAIYYGIKTGFNDAFVIDGSKRDELIKADPKSAEIIKPFLAGRDVKRFYLDFQDAHLILIPSGFTNAKRGSSEPEQYLASIYPAVFSHLEKYEAQCRKRYDQGEYWWELRACAYYEAFEKTKIEVASISIKPAFSMSYDGHYSNDKTTIVGSDSKALLGVLNSAVSYFFIKNTASTKSGGFFEYKPMYISQFPIPKDIEKPALIELVDKIETELKNSNQTVAGFLQLLQSKFDLEKPSTKLQQWPSLDFKGFLAEVEKGRKASASTRGHVPLSKKEDYIPLPLAEQAQWMAYFNDEKAKANALQSEIDRIDKEIDAMVYQLYGLTPEEIAIVEQS